MFNNQTKKLKAFRKLNMKSLDIEKKIKREILLLNKALLDRVKSRDDFLHDFYLRVECRFLYGESHPDWKIDGNNLVATVKFHATMFPPYLDNESPWTQLDSGKNYNEFALDNFYPFKDEHHCYLLHLLLKEIDPSSLDKMLAIETITSEIIVIYQHVTEFRGKPFESERLGFADINIDVLTKSKKDGKE